jgi:anti-sigma28 factor (negative regulator of flagellin synthesis)
MSTNSHNGKPKRKRSLTEITLNWLAERVRRTEKIKDEVSSGSYKVDSQKVAMAIVNSEES